jgi:hypothetical protein
MVQYRKVDKLYVNMEDCIMGIFKVKNDELLKGKQFIGFKRGDEYIMLYTYGEPIIVLKDEVEEVEGF